MYLVLPASSSSSSLGGDTALAGAVVFLTETTFFVAGVVVFPTETTFFVAGVVVFLTETTFFVAGVEETCALERFALERRTSESESESESESSESESESESSESESESSESETSEETFLTPTDELLLSRLAGFSMAFWETDLPFAPRVGAGVGFTTAVVLEVGRITGTLAAKLRGITLPAGCATVPTGDLTGSLVCTDGA